MVPRTVSIHDGESTTHPVGASTSSLADSLMVPKNPLAVHSYRVQLSTTIAIPTLAVSLQTSPLASWAGPSQFPYGPDNLPPLADWAWWVDTGAGVNDTTNWTMDPDGVHLDRATAWSNQSFTVFGTSAPTVVVALDPGNLDGERAVGTGFVLNAPGYANSIPSVPGYLQLAGGIHPTLVRITLGIPGALSGWNSTSGQPTFNFRHLDEELQFVESLGAQVMLSFPAGTWGDGNTLPTGTPLNASAPMSYGGATGSFPTPGAMYAIVRGVANHTVADSEAIEYWSIGNEVPLYSANETIAFATVIDASIAALRPEFSHALVGADDMLDGSSLPLFAAHSPSVGFLSFHWYPANVCQTANGTYCSPRGGSDGTTTPSLFVHPAFESHYDLLAPDSAVSEWRNLTGRTLPMLLAETNLGASGGIGTPSQNFGTDPRQQSLVGAAWLASMLVDASVENISAITYFGLTSAGNFSPPVTYAYGGFGFGLTNESSQGIPTYFAPYWAMSLWGSYIPAGAPSISAADSDPGVVSQFAVQNGSKVDLALVNRVALNATVQLSFPTSFRLESTSVLDDRSYTESYNATANSTEITRSGYLQTISPSSESVSIHGYGVAVLVLGPSTGGGNRSHGSNGSTSGAGGGAGAAGGSPPPPPHPSSLAPPEDNGASVGVLPGLPAMSSTLEGRSAVTGLLGLGAAASFLIGAIAAYRAARPAQDRKVRRAGRSQLDRGR